VKRRGSWRIKLKLILRNSDEVVTWLSMRYGARFCEYGDEFSSSIKAKELQHEENSCQVSCHMWTSIGGQGKLKRRVVPVLF